MYLDTLESQLKQMIKKSRAERVARKVQKKNFCYLRYFTKGCESIPQSLGFNLWTQISHEDVVMFWKRRKKGQN